MNIVTDTLTRRVREGMCVAICALLMSAPVHRSRAATLLDFPSPGDYSLGLLFSWQAGSSFLMPDPSQGPFTFSYSIDPGFLANQSNLPPGFADVVVSQMFSTWSAASRGWFSFAPAPWSAVQNAGSSPPFNWEGQSLNDWLAGNMPNVFPGWGANIDFFSVPSGFSITSQSTTFTMGPNNLAFAIVNREGSIAIRSVDIYLNEDFSWVDTLILPSGGSDPIGSTAEGYDIGTVLMHEVGHALGLDHPNQAIAKGSWNFNPYTFIPGQAWSMQNLMFSSYRGVRLRPTIDEVGGVACLYGLPSTLDLDGDGIVTSIDLSLMLSNWGSTTLGIPGDVNYDAKVDSIDLVLIINNFGVQPAPPTSAPVSMQQSTFDESRDDEASPIFFDCYYVAPHGAPNPQ